MRGRRARLGTGIALVAVVGVWLWARLLGEVFAPPQVAGHHDFFAFYGAAELMARHAPSAVYDPAALTAAERAVLNAPVGAAGYMPYLNPPFAAAAQSGLAATGEEQARLIWLGLTLAVAIAALWIAFHSQGARHAAAATLLVLLSFPTYQNLVEGQWSFVILVGLAGALAMTGTRAGALAAVLWLKPPLALLVAAWSAATTHWRVVAGMLGALAAAVIVFLPLTGVTVYPRYLSFLWQVSLSHLSGAGATGRTAWEGGLAQMEGINGAVAGYLGQSRPLLDDVVTGALDVLLAGTVIRLLGWQRVRHPNPTAAAALILTALLLDPHLYAQDLVLVVLLAPLLAGAVSRRAEALIGAVLLLDLAALDTEWSAAWPIPFPPHLVTLGFGVLALLLARRSRRDGENHLAELRTG